MSFKLPLTCALALASGTAMAASPVDSLSGLLGGNALGGALSADALTGPLSGANPLTGDSFGDGLALGDDALSAGSLTGLLGGGLPGLSDIGGGEQSFAFGDVIELDFSPEDGFVLLSLRTPEIIPDLVPRTETELNANAEEPSLTGDIDVTESDDAGSFEFVLSPDEQRNEVDLVFDETLDTDRRPLFGILR